MTDKRRVRKWPLYLIGSSAAVSVWSGWVGLGILSGFGIIHPLPGIWDGLHLNTAITLPIGVEAYGAYAMGAWMSPSTPKPARKFAKRSALGSLFLGMLGQIAYHLLAAAHRTHAPWEIVMAVSCLPVVTLGFAAALFHLLHLEREDEPQPAPEQSEPAQAENLPWPNVRGENRAHVGSAPWAENPRLAQTMERPAPWDDPTWVQPAPNPAPPSPEPPTEISNQVVGPEYAGRVTVRNPLNRLDRKIPVEDRVHNTGTFPAIQE